MPITFFPGIMAILTEVALNARAMSVDNPIIRDDLIPGAGSSSYSVTTGPGVILTILPLMPKSHNALSSF
ncbi:hypothetical protein CAXC1_40015 [Candidatus Xenohaliotis californiensis]|uniref:Uncharacterized protein n=1 Tax=Candidatus Xenohaliotis californiensis TaxID=84677 RepID=A0ABM9N8W1_9RICK|nr:hypothetical protein CAXC1_40015 [Candidatus Xenohaliotis californiensis]